MTLAGISENEIESIVRLAWAHSDFRKFQQEVAMLLPETHRVIISLSPIILDVLYQIALKGIEKGLTEGHGRYEF